MRLAALKPLEGFPHEQPHWYPSKRALELEKTNVSLQASPDLLQLPVVPSWSLTILTLDTGGNHTQSSWGLVENGQQAEQLCNHEPAGSTSKPSTPAHHDSHFSECSPCCAQPSLSPFQSPLSDYSFSQAHSPAHKGRDATWCLLGESRLQGKPSCRRQLASVLAGEAPRLSNCMSQQPGLSPAHVRMHQGGSQREELDASCTI